MGIKKLKKENDFMNMTLIDMFSKFDTTKTKKYTQFLVKMFIKKTNGYENDVRPLRESDPLDRVIPYTSWENALIRDYITDWIFSNGMMSRFVEFTELMEKGLIKENDISKYDSWEMLEINLFEAKNMEMFKKSKKEIQRIFEDEKFLILKPLTYASSCSYGYQTKWCTSMINDASYFYNHSKGILIYLIDKKENKRFAFYKHLPDLLDSYNEHENYIFKTFNQEDKQIDTIQTGLPQNILEIIVREMDLEVVTTTPNYKLFSEKEKQNMRDHIGYLPDETSEPMMSKVSQRFISVEQEEYEPDVENTTQPTQERESTDHIHYGFDIQNNLDVVNEILKDIEEHFAKLKESE